MSADEVRATFPRQPATPAKTDLPEFPDEIHATFVAESTTRNWVKAGVLTSNVGDELMDSQMLYLGKRLVKAWGAQGFEVTIKPIRKD